MEINTKRNLKKHTALVHCSNSLTLMQRKISNALLFHAFDELKNKDEHQITITELCKLIGYHGNNYNFLKEALRGLTSTSLEWNLVDERTKIEDWTSSSILASVNLRGALCTYEYSKRMRELIQMPAMFAKINLYIQSHFKSSYGLALYENCIRYYGLPLTSWFDIKLFRKMMGVLEDEYLIFRDFKRRVIDKAVYEVNSFANIYIEPEIVRKGRVPTKIRFHIKTREIKKPLGIKTEKTHSSNFSNDLETKLAEVYDIKQKTAKDILTTHSEEYILEKINMIENSKKFREGKIENLAGLLIEAIQKDYKVATPQASLRKKLASLEQQQAKEKKLDEIRTAFRKYQNKEILEKFNSLELEKKESLLTDFGKSLGKSLYRDAFEREGIKNILVQDQLIIFLKNINSHIIQSLSSFEFFTKNILKQEIA